MGARELIQEWESRYRRTAIKLAGAPPDVLVADDVMQRLPFDDGAVAYLSLRNEGDSVHIAWIGAKPQGAGHGGRVLRELIEGAERHDVMLKAIPLGGENRERLIRFYERHGFVATRGDAWAFTPKRKFPGDQRDVAPRARRTGILTGGLPMNDKDAEPATSLIRDSASDPSVTCRCSKCGHVTTEGSPFSRCPDGSAHHFVAASPASDR